MTQLTGGCTCGAVRYRLDAVPMFVHCCHCRDCQRQSGSAFVINALVETQAIEVEGVTPVPVPLPTESGRVHDVYRCPTCQTALWSDYSGRAGLRFVRAGTLDDSAVVQPDVHIFTRSRLPWVAIPPDQPAFEVYYDMQALWPAASLARRRAVTDR